GVKVWARRVPPLPMNELRNLADTFRGKLGSGVVLLGTETEGKATLLAAVTPDVQPRISAHELAQTMAPIVGGKGGGKPDLAQAGGKDPSQNEAGPSPSRFRGMVSPVPSAGWTPRPVSPAPLPGRIRPATGCKRTGTPF